MLNFLSISSATDMMNLTHWKLLVAVALHRNMTHAAAQIGITQSAASQAISQLEKSLGVTLINRSRTAISLTDVGYQVVEQAQQMVDKIDNIRALANQARGLNQGRVRLGCFPSVVSVLLPDMLKRFSEHFPDINLSVVEGSDEEVERWLGRAEVDLGVVLNPQADREAIILGQDRWIAIIPTQHRLARTHRVDISLHQLHQQPFILATGGCTVNGESLMLEAGLQLTDVRIRVRDWASACVLVKEGMGVAIVPESTLPASMTGIYAVPLVPLSVRRFGLVRAKAALPSAVVNTFWDFAARTFK
jgi:DNA-binding transcriptional LysR family regulator